MSKVVQNRNGNNFLIKSKMLGCPNSNLPTCGYSNSLATAKHTHHEFSEPRKSYSPGFPEHDLPPLFKLHPEKGSNFLDIHNRFQNALFSSLLELSIFCHMTLIAFAVLLSFVPLFPIQLHSVSPTSIGCIPNTRVRVCLCARSCCESNKTKKYSPET